MADACGLSPHGFSMRVQVPPFAPILIIERINIMTTIVPIFCIVGIIIAPIFPECEEKLTAFLCGVLVGYYFIISLILLKGEYYD